MSQFVFAHPARSGYLPTAYDVQAIYICNVEKVLPRTLIDF